MRFGCAGDPSNDTDHTGTLLTPALGWHEVWRSASYFFVCRATMTSYAHTVNDPTSTISSLNEEVSALKTAVEATFNKPMAEILADLEGSDADARAQDANAVLHGRLTGAKLLVSAAYVFLDVIWSTSFLLTQCTSKVKGWIPRRTQCTWNWNVCTLILPSSRRPRTKMGKPTMPAARNGSTQLLPRV